MHDHPIKIKKVVSKLGGPLLQQIIVVNYDVMNAVFSIDAGTPSLFTRCLGLYKSVLKRPARQISQWYATESVVPRRFRASLGYVGPP